MYCPPGFIDGTGNVIPGIRNWRDEGESSNSALASLGSVSGNRLFQ